VRGFLVALLFIVLGATAVEGQTISYSARTLAGAEVRVGAGEPVTLVAVFATWCTTCRTEFGVLDSLQKVLAPRGVRVLALSVDAAGDAHVQKYVDARKTRVMVARDASGAVGKTFGAVGVPETYLVDGKGMVRWRGRGDLRMGITGLRQALKALK
jgi:thiol-disulfide isomerase/thioredoxin